MKCWRTVAYCKNTLWPCKIPLSLKLNKRSLNKTTKKRWKVYYIYCLQRLGLRKCYQARLRGDTVWAKGPAVNSWGALRVIQKHIVKGSAWSSLQDQKVYTSSSNTKSTELFLPYTSGPSPGRQLEWGSGGQTTDEEMELKSVVHPSSAPRPWQTSEWSGPGWGRGELGAFILK